MCIKLSTGLILGEEPRVAGVISTLGSLDLYAKQEKLPPCDLLELRLGEIDLHSDTWLDRAITLGDKGMPILITIRNDEEGGTWKDADPERLRLFHLGLSKFSIVDVELNSHHLYRVIELAQEAGKPVVVSWHNFNATPSLDELNAFADQISDFDDVILKIAAQPGNPGDIKILEQFLSQDAPFPRCVLAMGEAWKETRISFPLLGSCLTYGYLDTPSAPGQYSCAELRELLAGPSHS